MNTIKIPESLQFYYQAPGNAAAIYEMVSKLPELPELSKTKKTNLGGWDDLATYHKALLAAHQTKVDFLLFYQDVWRMVWRPAVEALGGVEFAADDYERGELNINYVWDYGFYRMHTVHNGQLYSGVECTDKEIYIWFSYDADANDSYELSDQLKLSPEYWLPEPSENYWYTKYEIAPLAKRETLDITLLQNAALEVSDKLAEALRSAT